MTTRIEKMYTVPQAAEKLGLSARTVERRLQEGLIAAVREPSGRIKIPRSALAAYRRSMPTYERPYTASANHPAPRHKRSEPMTGVIQFV